MTIDQHTDLAARRQDTGRSGSKRYQVTVYAPEIGETIGVLGGNRAARANAAIVTSWREGYKPDGEPKAPGVYGLRADFAAAQAEAARLASKPHNAWAAVVPVTEA